MILLDCLPSAKLFLSKGLGLGGTGLLLTLRFVAGFALPHHFNLWDLDASVAYRLGKIELRGGARALHFRSSSQSDYWVRGTLSGAFVGVRWYSD